MAGPSYSVVIPARNASGTLPRVLRALADQDPAPAEVLVVDDCSDDDTAALAAAAGARVLSTGGVRSAGGARNEGWDAAETGEVVVFLDSDAVPLPGWGAGVVRAATEFDGALVGCARTFDAETRWGWICHLQVETPYLPRGAPRETSFLSSFCLLVPRAAPLRWDESYGGEDALFSADAAAAGLRLVFDPRFVARHEHERRTFADLRRQQRRLAYGLSRAASLEQSRAKRVLRRVPLHYFLLVRLPFIFRRVSSDRRLRGRFLTVLPGLALAEWTLGGSAVRYALRRPSLRGETQPLFQ